MSQKHLKAIRVIFSILILIAISLLFVDFRELIPTKWTDRILLLQFIPSVIKFITIPAIVSAGFIVVLIITYFFGRVYCSALCPLGIFQDIFSWISKKAGIIKRYKYKKALNYLRYPFLGITVVFLIFGSMFILNLLDPYSSFGRIFSDIIRPGIILANNKLAIFLEKFDMYFLYRLNLDLITWHTVLIPIVSLALIIWMSVYFGRLYCNSLCPVGTVLGIISRFSFYKIKIDMTGCTKCGKCSFACKSNCIDIKNQAIDNSRCVACYNCISVCEQNSIKYSRLRHKQVVETANQNRRNFIGKTIASVAALSGFSNFALSSMAAESDAGKIPNKKNNPVSPPGSISLKHFTDRCTACHLCVSACPTNVLQPSFLEYGIMGMSQPHMNYNIEYCNFECTKCGEVCPTGAILPLTIEEKKLEQIGKVNFVIEKCVVYTDNTACGSCSEHCPTQAVTMVPYKEELTIPEIKVDFCIGCGACEFACPVRPHTAIFVDGNSIHQVAMAPIIEELDIKSGEEFPF